MKKVSYRVLYNQDCTNLFGTTREPLEPRHVDGMVDEVAEGGADVLLVNPNAQRVNYPSRVWQTFWDGYASGDSSFFGSVPADQVTGRRRWVEQMKRLADQGCDYMARALARCREKLITPGITIRMNDMHDVPWPDSHLFSRFYREHPEFHLNSPSYVGWGATGLNYAHSQVRGHYLSLIGELVGGYDFDVLELDFLRFANYFPRDGQFEKWGTVMTGFVADVRRILSGSGRRIALIPRVAATPAAARELGFDVGVWAREGLVEGIGAGHFLNTGWHTSVDAFRNAVGKNVAVYAYTDYTADRRDGLPMRYLPLEPCMMRGVAAGYLAAGADGMGLFNFFCAREENPRREPMFEHLKEMRSLRALRGKPKTCLLSAGVSLAETDASCQVPVTLSPQEPRAFWMFLAAETADIPAELAVVFEGEAQADRLWLHFNEMPLGWAREIREGPADKRKSRIALFTIPATALLDGRNHIAIRHEGDQPLTILSVEVRVGASTEGDPR